MLKASVDGARLSAGTGHVTIDSPAPAPIVFVPGVMGSRLKIGNNAWDPDDAKNMLGWAARDPLSAADILDVRGGSEATVMQAALMEEPIEWDDRLAAIWKLVDPKQRKDYYGKLRGWSGVAKDFYYELLVSLEVFFNSPPFVPGAHPVYAFGYDWRKSNAESGKNLVTRIDQVLKDTPGASKVVLVTHSMGGLVARHAVHPKGGNGASKVKGVVHVVQPVNGAVQAYRRFAEGVAADRGGFFDIEAKVFAAVLGGSWWGYTLMMSGMDGPVQLLPNQAYGGWLVDHEGIPVPQGNIYDMYASDAMESVVHAMDWKLARKLGFGKLGESEDTTREALERAILAQGLPWDPGDIEKTRAKRVLDRWAERCDKLRTGLARAKEFHEIVVGSAHGQTFMLYAGDRKTEVRYDWSKEEGDRLGYEDQGGDGTVPVASARGLNALVEKAWGTSLPGPVAPHRNVGGQEHSAVFGDSAVVDEVRLLTFFLIRLEKPPEKVQKECFLQSIDVECEHAAKRGFKMKLPAPKGAQAPVNVLEIVAGGKSGAEKVTVTGSFASPRCAKHNAHVWEMTSGGTTKKFNEERSSADLAYGEINVRLHALRWLWPWSTAPTVYRVNAHSCYSPASEILVRVFPAIEPEISLKFALDTNDRVKNKIKDAQKNGYVETRGRPAQTEWTIELAAKVKYGAQVFELTAELEGKIKQIATINRLVKRAIDRFAEYFFKYTGVTILPVFPNLSLEYSGKFKEIDGSARVGSEWSVAFKATPLIGLTVKIDIIKALIEALGKLPAPPLVALSKGLDRLRTLAKDHGVEFEINLAFSGKIDGEIKGTKTARGKPAYSGSVTGKVKAELSAKSTLGGKGVVSAGRGMKADEDGYLGFEIGAEMKASTGIFGKLEMNNNEKGVYLGGKLGILACNLEYAAWASVKVFWEVKESVEGDHTFWKDTDLLSSPDLYLMRREEAGGSP